MTKEPNALAWLGVTVVSLLVLSLIISGFVILASGVFALLGKTHDKVKEVNHSRYKSRRGESRISE